jgi:prepilin-type N-terminal cleavage/methylation domain-containing protein
MRLSRYAGPFSKTVQPGFTLAETMVVLVIAAMMITLAIPRVDVTRYKADAIAQIVRTQLQNASRASITRQHDVIVSFDTLGQQMVTTFDANNNGIIDAGERVSYRGLDTGILFADPTVKGVSGNAITAPISGATLAAINGMPSLVFHRDGSVSSDAEIYVSIAARGPKMYRGLVVTQATGRVDWYRLNTTTSKWVIAGL